MKVILATSNKGKIKEIKEILGLKNVVAYKDILKDIEIEETGKSFKENALLKAKTIFEMIKDRYKDAIVISDDSGISVPALNNEPGIYSARYAGVNATDKDNLNKLINELKKRGIKRTKAYYTAAIAIVSSKGEYVVHGWMYGDVIDEARGDKGFGYDPMFIPEGFDKTLGELDKDIKSKISHRAKALKLAKIVLNVINKK